MAAAQTIVHEGWHVNAEKNGIIDEELADSWKNTLASSPLPLLPEMLFDRNTVSLTHPELDVALSFSVKDALQCWVYDPLPSLKVAAAKRWEKHLTEFGTGTSDFDWTFSTKYKGTFTKLSDATALSPNADFHGDIDYDLLKRQDPILLFADVILFEDELADNGVSKLSIKIRVMPTCFFVLQRFWCRVDNVIFRVFDTRIFHKFGTKTIVRDFQWFENTFDELRKQGKLPGDPFQYTDEALMVSKMTQREHKIDGFILK